MRRKAVKTHYYWRKKRIAWVFIIIAVLLLIPVPILTLFLFQHVNYKNLESTPPLQKLYKAEDYKLVENVQTIGTADGEYLWCSEIKASRQPRAVVIFMAGVKEPSVTAYYGHAAWLQQKGYTSFLLELRAHGESTGDQLGFGYTEVEDVKAMVKYIKSQEEYKNLPLVVFGTSLGGSVAINAAGQIPEVDGCIAVSPMASMETQLDLLMKSWHIPGFIRAVEVPILKQVLKIVYGADAVENMSPEKQIMNVGDRPVLLMASAGDSVIPAENSFVLQRAWDSADVWVRNSEDHFVLWNNDFNGVANDKEYCDRVIAAILKAVQRHKAYVLK